jgi:CxxC motif-containing protein
MMKEELICIQCPLGCHLSVEHDGTKIQVVTGHECKRGLVYAEKEIFQPQRTVTTTVAVQGSYFPLLPVKTDAPVPKSLTQDIVKTLSALVVEAPVKSGDIVLSDALGTGSNIVATRSAPKRI